MLVGATSCTAMTCAMAVAVTPFGQLEIDAEGLALAVDKLAKLTAGAVCWLAVAECTLAALPHVRMGPAEADDA